jgi:hypothetical protein
MRTYSSIPLLLSVLFAAPACDSSPVGTSDLVTVIGDQPGTPPCPVNPAAPEFVKRTSCAAQ